MRRMRREHFVSASRERVVAQHERVPQRRRDVEADQHHHRVAEPLVHVFERVGERLVDGHERRQRESEQRHRLAVRLHHRDADERQHDQQPVERPLDRVRGAALPRRRRRIDRRFRVREAPREAEPHEREHDETDLAVPVPHAAA